MNSEEVTIRFKDREEIIYSVESILSVCQTALMHIGDNGLPHLNEFERQVVLGSSVWEVSSALDLAKQLTRELTNPG